MEKVIKKWRDNNKDKLKLQKKREKIRNILRKYNILPKYGDELNEEQTKIMEQISNNNFSFYENFKFEKHKQTITYKKRVHKESERPVLKRARLLYELRESGILPKLGEHINEIQKEIINFVEENYETPIKSFITKYSHLTSPEYSIWYRTKNSVRKHKNRRHSEEHFNIEISDVFIPEYCPYLGIKLSTNINDCFSPNYFTIDRIDSSKGYIKGNIQVISRLANTMKNNATIEELITFSENVIKRHKGQIS
jgi:hypothetical protein